MTELRLLKVHEAAEKCGVSRAKFYLLVGQCKLPPPVAVGKSRRWRSSDLDSWILTGAWEADPLHVELLDTGPRKYPKRQITGEAVEA